jgi:mRNA-degrading endonuclease RelE of RelBE toxin-antitoxin system
LKARVVVSDDARADLRTLYAEDRELVGEALRAMKALERNPYAGERLREKSNRRPLAEADCRKLKFDLPGRPPAAGSRYRIVYRVEPNEGSPEEAFVIIVATKQIAYGQGAARAARRLREEARGRLRDRGLGG